MHYLDQLPKISSVSTGEGELEYELESEIYELRDLEVCDDTTWVFVGEYANQIVVAVGQILEYEVTQGMVQENQEGTWSRLKMKGHAVTFNI